MPARIKVQAIERAEVELGLSGDEAVFTVRLLTRELDAVRHEYEVKVVPAQTNDEAVALSGEVLDALLEPEPGKRRKPSALLREMWDGGHISTGQVATLMEQVFEATEARPT